MVEPRKIGVALGLLLALTAPKAGADAYDITIEVFKSAGESATFFDRSYAYAAFPTVGKAGFWVGGTFGEGKVFIRGKAVGKSSIAGLSVGFQAGGQVYSMIPIRTPFGVRKNLQPRDPHMNRGVQPAEGR